MTLASISEVTAPRTNLWSECHRRPSPLWHVNLSERERERGGVALPVERCPKCHGLVWEVTDSVCVSVWRGNKTTEKSRGHHPDLSFCQGQSRSVALRTTLKDLILLSPWQVCVSVCVCVVVFMCTCGCVHPLWKLSFMCPGAFVLSHQCSYRILLCYSWSNTSLHKICTLWPLTRCCFYYIAALVLKWLILTTNDI